MRNMMLFNSVNLMMQAEFSPLNCLLSPQSYPPPPFSPPTPLHLVVPVERRLMNSKIIDFGVLAHSS